jgi:hypothetical protein
VARTGVPSTSATGDSTMTASPTSSP